MSLPPPSISHPLFIYLADDGSIWGVNSADGRAYQLQNAAGAGGGSSGAVPPDEMLESEYSIGIGAANPEAVDHAMYADLAGHAGSADLGGAPGPPGPPGPEGAPGAAGPQGPTGAQGAIGPVGPQGETGLIGPQGIQGIQGAPGPQGLSGDPGTGLRLRGTVPTVADLPTSGNTSGDMWVVVATNDCWAWDGVKWNNVGPIQGPKGDTGPQGPQGVVGATGPQGATGPAGPQGITGATGPQGIQGIAGPQGIQGPPGPTAVSTDSGNQARLGADTNIFVPAPAVGEAPADGQTYARQNSQWIVVPTVGAWQLPAMVNGSSQAGTTVRYRLEPGKICRLSGVFQFSASDGTSKITGLPAPENGNCYFAQTGIGNSLPCDWQLLLNATGAMSFYIVTPSSVKAGGICGLNGISYIHV